MLKTVLESMSVNFLHANGAEVGRVALCPRQRRNAGSLVLTVPSSHAALDQIQIRFTRCNPLIPLLKLHPRIGAKSMSRTEGMVSIVIIINAGGSALITVLSPSNTYTYLFAAVAYFVMRMARGVCYNGCFDKLCKAKGIANKCSFDARNDTDEGLDSLWVVSTPVIFGSNH